VQITVGLGSSKNYERWDTNDDILPVYVFFRLPCIIVFEVCCLCSTPTPSSKVASGGKGGTMMKVIFGQHSKRLMPHQKDGKIFLIIFSLILIPICSILSSNTQ